MQIPIAKLLTFSFFRHNDIHNNIYNNSISRKSNYSSIVYNGTIDDTSSWLYSIMHTQTGSKLLKFATLYL